MEVLRTPDERFADLPGWHYPPRYVDDLPGYDGLRMHYVDEGPRDAPVTFVCLHGEPTWSYLYRRMIPVFSNAGHRAVAPDLFGFGRSDKPADEAAYTFAFHRDALKRFFERLDLLDACLVVQDWGGLLGLTLPMDYPERITRLVVMNTGLGVGRPAGPGFEAWRAYNAANPDLDVAALMKRSVPMLSEPPSSFHGSGWARRSWPLGCSTPSSGSRSCGRCIARSATARIHCCCSRRATSSRNGARRLRVRPSLTSGWKLPPRNAVPGSRLRPDACSVGPGPRPPVPAGEDP
jgi:haloalkane dehalogenase